MAVPGFTLFDTAIGRCGIAWGRRGITAVQLPESCDGETRRQLRAQVPAAGEAPPPPGVARAIAGIVALLHGEPNDLATVTLDMDAVPPFHRRVYEVARTIAPGSTLSYGEVAVRAGSPAAARAVGQALGHNPFAIIVPCHRVLAAGGGIGGFSANGGTITKRRLLAIEGAWVSGQRGLFDDPGETRTAHR